jgi:2-polyprenyl-6-methoxyphenol hydroxylase-like FAD-dependent oxidoreductase
METLKDKKVLVSGASMAGLSTAFWMNKLGYKVTVVELANEPRTAGAAVDLRGDTTDVVKRMGIFEQLKANSLHVERIEFKNAEDVTEGSMMFGEGPPSDDIEIERDKFVAILLDELKNNVEFIFNDSITALNETKDAIQVTFKNGPQRSFDLVFGCDGIHSAVRKIWFGHETEYSHFLGAYFSITIVNKLLVKQKTMQAFGVPDKAIMLNAYNNKTDIIFCFNSDVQQSKSFYFDKFCQIKMPSWTKGRVALVGDAGYCASPAAGMGASLSVSGAGALADALLKHQGNFELAFHDYNQNLRPFIEEVQAIAELNVRENFIPRTEEAIRKRNTQTEPW